MNCGQRLDWSPVKELCIEILMAEDADEAAWIAKEYYEAEKTDEQDQIDIDKWRQSLPDDGTELYLLFRSRKAHGSFMRRYAKEGTIHDG